MSKTDRMSVRGTAEGARALFGPKVRGARRSLVLTRIGHESIDKNRERLGGISLGDYVEALDHLFGKLLERDQVEQAANVVNEAVSKKPAA